MQEPRPAGPAAAAALADSIAGGASCRPPAEDGFRNLVRQRFAILRQTGLGRFDVLRERGSGLPDSSVRLGAGCGDLSGDALLQLLVRLLLGLVDFAARGAQSSFIIRGFRGGSLQALFSQLARAFGGVVALPQGLFQR